jgi:hypothetical protein
VPHQAPQQAEHVECEYDLGGVRTSISSSSSSSSSSSPSSFIVIIIIVIVITIIVLIIIITIHAHQASQQAEHVIKSPVRQDWDVHLKCVILA